MAAGMAKQAVQNAGGAGTAPNMDNLGDLFDEAKIREQASSFGLGVRFVSSEPIAQSGLTGVKATFAFDDVRLLNLNNRQSGASATPTPQLRFDLEKPAADGPTLLRIRLPQGTRSPDDPPADAAAAPTTAAQRPDLPPEALAMVRSMFKGARVSVAVEVDGAIVTTDGPKRDGSRVTIFGLDFEQLLSDPVEVLGAAGPEARDRLRHRTQGARGRARACSCRRPRPSRSSSAERDGGCGASGRQAESRPRPSRRPTSRRQGCRTMARSTTIGAGEAPRLSTRTLKR